MKKLLRAVAALATPIGGDASTEVDMDYLRDLLAYTFPRAPRASRGRTRYVSQALRVEVIARDGLTCGICGTRVEPSDLHIDHIVPLSAGGPTEATNLRVTHSRCNILKGAS